MHGVERHATFGEILQFQQLIGPARTFTKGYGGSTLQDTRIKRHSLNVSSDDSRSRRIFIENNFDFATARRRPCVGGNTTDKLNRCSRVFPPTARHGRSLRP